MRDKSTPTAFEMAMTGLFEIIAAILTVPIAILSLLDGGGK